MGDGTFTVLLTEQRPLDVRTFGPLLQEMLGLHRIDANRQVRRQRGFIAVGLDEETANRLADALDQKGVAAEVVDGVFIERLPRSKSAYYIDGWTDGLIVGKEKTGEIPWSRVALITVGALLPALPEGSDIKSDYGGTFTAGLSAEERALLRERQVDAADDPGRSPLAKLGEWLEVIDKKAFDLIESEIPEFVLDVGLRDPESRFRVEGRNMISTPLADERSSNWLRNLWVMTKRLAGFVPEHLLTDGTRAFIARRPSVHLAFDLDTEFDENTRWFWHRRREAELAELMGDDDATAPADGDSDAAGSGTATGETETTEPAGDES